MTQTTVMAARETAQESPRKSLTSYPTISEHDEKALRWIPLMVPACALALLVVAFLIIWAVL